MNSLQISLIVLAVIVVGGVLFYNWLQDRKYRKQWTATFGQQEDVLLQPVGERVDPVVQEPSFPAHDSNAYSPAAANAPGGGETDVAEVAVAGFDDEPDDMVDSVVPPVELPPVPLDPLLDFSVLLRTIDAIPNTALAKLMDGQRAEGRTVRGWGYANGYLGWTEISPWREQTFTDVAIAVQIAERAGAVGDRQLADLARDASQLAADFNGVASWNDIAPVLARARELDRFCVEVDVLIGLNVVSPDGVAFAGTAIAERAQSGGMVLNDAGVYQRCNERGDVLYTLCNHEDTPFSAHQMADLTTHGVTLLFEVPRVENGVEVFAEMAKFGSQLAKALGGKLVDDNIRLLSAAGIEKIQVQLAQIYQQMVARDIPAGSPRALRLFS